MSDQITSYVVIDARARKCYTPNPPFRMLGVMALDLPSDLWQDFLYFMEAARAAEEAGIAEQRYRFVRASLLCLFAHLNAFFDILIQSRKEDATFQEFKRRETARRRRSPEWPTCEHGRFVLLYSDFVKSSQSVTLPEIDWSIKPLRNLLAHPNGVRDITVADLYDLDLSKLQIAALSFHSWILEACKHCSIDYQIDTASIVSKFVASRSSQECKLQEF